MKPFYISDYNLKISSALPLLYEPLYFEAAIFDDIGGEFWCVELTKEEILILKLKLSIFLLAEYKYFIWVYIHPSVVIEELKNLRMVS